MKPASISAIKKELNQQSKEDLLELCLKLGKFKKENKEFLSYLIYDSEDEMGFINDVKLEMDDLFAEINTDSFFYIKKSLRKILRLIKKYIRFSKRKQTEVELLIHYCQHLKKFKPSIFRLPVLTSLYQRQISSIEKAIAALHEDLRFDYEALVTELKEG